MNRKYFVLQSEHLISLASEFCAQYQAVQQARLDFTRRHGGLMYLGSSFGVHGLRFANTPEKGWVRRASVPGFSAPDISTHEGREIAMEMLALPPMPVPDALSQAIHFIPTLRITPNGTAVVIGVERLGDKHYVSIPTASAEDLEINPSLAWKPVAGMMPASEETYLADRLLAQQEDAVSPAPLQP